MLIMASTIAKARIKDLMDINKQDPPACSIMVDHLLTVIRKDLEDFNVHFDCWTHETKVATKESINAILDLTKRIFYEKDSGVLVQIDRFRR